MISFGNTMENKEKSLRYMKYQFTLKVYKWREEMTRISLLVRQLFPLEFASNVVISCQFNILSIFFLLEVRLSYHL